MNMANPFEVDIDQEMSDKYTKVQSQYREISYNDIAARLLKDNLLLTALELYTELLEAGREVPRLKEFFSNPGNFEQQALTKPDVAQIRRSSSQVTLDSLDLTRYSEDGERGTDERVAVLEFELRKAKETISALRANLTVATESEANTPDGSTGNKQLHNEPIKPHEQRALNFLLNEYLMTYGYKLTSITFSDENENQDFEDWDDVGLNIPKPAELLHLYRDFMRQSGQEKGLCHSVGCQTEEKYLEKDSVLQDMAMEVEQLKEQLSVLDQEKQELQRLWVADNRMVTMSCDISSVTTPGSDLPCVLTGSTPNSGTPECFEMLDAETKEEEESSALQDEDELPVSLADTDTDWTQVGSMCGLDSMDCGNRVPNENSSTDCGVSSEHQPLPEAFTSRSLPAAFQKEVLSCCFVDTSKQQEAQSLLGDFLQKEKMNDILLPLLSQTLSRIIPNIILNKREEIIPLVILTIQIHPEAESRDKLLNLFFNLKKKPSEEERRTIIAGLVAIAKCSGPSLVETEVLPQCWEQMSHKHIERRLLVVESCSALTPYVSSSIRNSLMLSMLQQMLLEDKEEIVRETVVRSLALIIMYMDDKDKYFQCEELAMTALDDPGRSVIATTTHVLFPVLAQWALDLGRLHSHLLTRLLQRIRTQVKSPVNSPGTVVQKSAEQRMLSSVTVLKTLVPYIVISVVGVKVITESLEQENERTSRQIARHKYNLTNPNIFWDTPYELSEIMGTFDNFVDQEWYEEWPELEWVFAQMIPDILDIVQGLEVTTDDTVVAFIKFFRNLCAEFGSTIIRQKVKPCFIERVQNVEVSLTNIGNGNACPALAIVPVYLVGVLDPLKDEDLEPVLQRFLCALPTCGAPLNSLDVTVRFLLGDGMNCHEQVLDALWKAVVHPRPSVRRAAATLFSAAVPAVGEKQIAARVVPALVTLASDSDLGVRTATIPACGKIISNTSIKEVHDKVYLQLRTIMADAGTRDNHTSLMQLVQTIGAIVSFSEPSFRDEVILPQLAGTAAFASQLSNTTRRIELTRALIEAFSAAVCCPLSKQTITTALLPGLRYLEPITSTALYTHHETVMAMIRGAESRFDSQRPADRSSSLSLAVATANVGQGVEDMKNRMSKIFQNKPITNRTANIPNLQGIFRKK